MTHRKKFWLASAALVFLLGALAAVVAARKLAQRFQPEMQRQAIRYLEQRFHGDVDLRSLHLTLPKMSTLQVLMRHGRGAVVTVEGDDFALHFAGSRDLPPLFSAKKLSFYIDLGILSEPHKVVPAVVLEGMQINIPPKGRRPDWNPPSATGQNNKPMDVVIEDVQIKDAQLILLPRDSTKTPLTFDISKLHMTPVSLEGPMRYVASLSIPKPPGAVLSQGTFGPWNATEPGDTPLAGDYKYENADLAVFNAIAGTLASTGNFHGTLDAVEATGQATVPDFRLKSVGNAVPLTTRFEVLVDGTNGNTILQPVQARLGRTSFTTTGAVVKHEKQTQRSIDIQVSMPKGDLRDLLRLAIKGSPFLEGIIDMNATVRIPPLSGPVRDKLYLNGEFKLDSARFLRSTIQSQIDNLSRKGQGKPKDEEIDQVASSMSGSFQLEDRSMTFRSFFFEVPGASVALTGTYDLAGDQVSFHGALALDAKLSQTQTGLKRWLLKPVDPFFSKHGAGTFLRVQVEGDAHHPKFGLDHSKPDQDNAVQPHPRSPMAARPK